MLFRRFRVMEFFGMTLGKASRELERGLRDVLFKAIPVVAVEFGPFTGLNTPLLRRNSKNMMKIRISIHA